MTRTGFAFVVCVSALWCSVSGIAQDGAGVEGLRTAIEQIRCGTVHVLARAGARVHVEQLEHEFWFGTAISRKMWSDETPKADRARYLEVLKANFNAAVHENALKWYHLEENEDELRWDDADRMLAWCRENRLRVRGHTVFWADEKYVQDWLKDLGDEALRARLEQHAKRIVRRYKERIHEWDVNNEMVHCNYYEERLGADIRAAMFRWCRKADPDAVLYVNDYGVLTGGDLAKYEKHIRGLLEAGAPVGGIGLQGHFNRPADPRKVRRVLDRLAAFRLPIRITEYDCNAPDEKARARSLTDLYRTAFAHPAVTGILMWGFWEGCHWRPDAAIWRKDWTPTPAADAYRRLVFKEWWTDETARLGDSGAAEFRAFYGRHRVTIDGNDLEVVLKKARDGIWIDARNPNPELWTVSSHAPLGERAGLLDIVLCIDRSGSMIDDIKAVQQVADGILAQLQKFGQASNISIQVGLVTYTRHDEPDWIRGRPLSADIDTVRQYLRSINITDVRPGSGGREDTYAALLYAMNETVGGQKMAMGWRPGAAKIAIPITDEPPDDPDWEGNDLARVAAVAEALDPVHMYPLILPKRGPAFLDSAVRAAKRLAEATGGETITVPSASALPGKLTEAVRLAVRRHRREVWREANPPYILYGASGLLAAAAIAFLAIVIRKQLRLHRQAAVRHGRVSKPPVDPSLTGRRRLDE
jgi:GH35 family endo-1,4-beta-xylanase